MSDLWRRVDELVGTQNNLADLRAHRLQLIAARRWRFLGIDVPDNVENEERLMMYHHLIADALLKRLREHLDGPILVFKGPEVAAHYPDPLTRPFADLDLLVPDPAAAYSALTAAGFIGVGQSAEFYEGLHHLQPLAWPTLPLAVELHHHPSWVEWTNPPYAADLLADAVSARTGQAGILAPSPAAHALILAVNSWSDAPFRCVLDLVDIAAVLDDIDPRTVQPLADEWDVGRVWSETTAAIDFLFGDGPRPSSMRIWARATATVRDITVTENHFRRLASCFWSLPPRRALRLFLRTLGAELLPSDNESWRRKLTRMLVALRNAFRNRSHHDQILGSDAHRFPSGGRRRASEERGPGESQGGRD